MYIYMYIHMYIYMYIYHHRRYRHHSPPIYRYTHHTL